MRSEELKIKEIKDKAEELRKEARALLCQLLRIPPDDGSSNMIDSKRVDRLIDCIMGCCMLENAALLKQAMPVKKGE